MAVAVHVAHTGSIDSALLDGSHALLWRVFEDMTEEDWEHALGGVHAVATDRGEVVGHASVVQRRILHCGAPLRAGYVEAVAVHPDRRRQGIGAALMAPLEQLIGRAYDFGCLGATEEAIAFYTARGWQLWRGPLSALTMVGPVPTPDEQDCIHVLSASADLDLDGDLMIADLRPGDAW